MSQHDRMFRKTSFGGFNKQDVAAYVKSMSREHQEETDALRGVADKLRAECNTYKRQIDERQQTQEEIVLRNADLSETLALRDEELDTLRRGALEAGSELERVRAELHRVQGQVGALTDETRDALERAAGAEERIGQSEELAEELSKSLERHVAELAAQEAQFLIARKELTEERSQSALLSEKLDAQSAALKQYEDLYRAIEIEVGSVADFRERLAGAERAARQRAEAIEAEARRNAELANETMLRDAAEMKNRLLALRREAAAAAVAAVSELEKARTQLEYVDAVFAGLDERMDGIVGGSTGPVIRDFVPEEFN